MSSEKHLLRENFELEGTLLPTAVPCETGRLLDAPSLETYNEKFGGDRTRLESAQIRHGGVIADRRKQEEDSSVDAGKRFAIVKRNKESEGLKIANEKAKYQMKVIDEPINEDAFNASSSKIEEAPKCTNAATTTKEGGGYETAAYEVSEYKGTDYDTQEYKSVYD